MLGRSMIPVIKGGREGEIESKGGPMTSNKEGTEFVCILLDEIMLTFCLDSKQDIGTYGRRVKSQPFHSTIKFLARFRSEILWVSC